MYRLLRHTMESSLFCTQCIDFFDMRAIECSLFCIQCIDCLDIPWNLVYFVHNVSTASTCVLLNVVFILHTMYRLLRHTMESSLFCTQCIDCFDMCAIECSFYFAYNVSTASTCVPLNVVYFVHNVSTASTCFDCFDIYRIWWYGWKALVLSIPKLFSDWKSVEY